MRIAEYIKDVRSRTEEEKQRVVILWTIIFIVIIFFIWLVSFTFSVANNNAEEARLQAEAERIALEKAEALASASSTETTGAFKGVIPEIKDFVSEGAGTVVDGFWVIGNLLHR